MKVSYYVLSVWILKKRYSALITHKKKVGVQQGRL